MSALGLADYGSSDDDDDDRVVPPPAQVSETAGGQVRSDATPSDKGKEAARNSTQSQDTRTATPTGPALGPAPGPAAMPSDLFDNPSALLPEDDGQPPASPHTANRQLVRNLTMPPIPNFDIPPSPPGSPPPATTAKFARFLDLKTKGVHFNERLHQSSALRNPGLLGKLMKFAGISQEDQYASALPEALAVTTKFPDWAYADKLVKEHERIAKKKEDERARMQREAIDFVPAKAVDTASTSAAIASSVGRSADRPVNREAKRSRFDDAEKVDTKRSRFDDKRGTRPTR